LDLPLGTFKISYNRGSGGHKGLESIIRALKTREFIRIRIGIAPTTPGGKLKKPDGDEAVQKFILSDFKDSEKKSLKPVFKNILDAVRVMVDDGLAKAMNKYN
jgi:PTH1 family peptidyl-tRNA hydrolase